MIKLIKFGAVWGLPSASPFCLKLETYLRMTKLPYESVVNPDLRLAPYRKLPYIKDNGKKVALLLIILKKPMVIFLTMVLATNKKRKVMPYKGY